jgi:hypothetical protein
LTKIFTLVSVRNDKGWSTKWTKVKAHTGSQIGHYFGNFRADELANRGAKKDLEL